MDTWVLILIIAIAAVVAVAIIFIAMNTMQKRQSEGLQNDFGPEYDRALESTGDRKQAESELRDRKERVKKYALRPLSSEDRKRFTDEWSVAQSRFVDDPSGAIGDADQLVQDAMNKRGFPVRDFEQNAADISVEHPYVVEHYRAAHEISVANENGKAETEDLRQAMVHYRSLFEELVNATGPEDIPARDTPAEGDRASGDDTHRPAGRLGQVRRRR